MPNKLTVTLGPNTFDAEGDFAFDEGFNAALRSWINAQGQENPGAVDDLADRLKAANDAAAQTVADNTPSTDNTTGTDADDTRADTRADTMEESEMLDFSKLEQELTRNEEVDASAKALMERLFAEVEANKNDPAALQALVDRGRSANDALAAAVVANTPADTTA